MKSMTGFGSLSGCVGGTDIEVAIKGVNGRYLEIRSHLPRKYMSLEATIVQMCKKQFRRGTMDVHIHFSQKSAVREISFSTEIAQEWLHKARKAFKELKVEPRFTTQDILSIPDFIQIGDSNLLTTEEEQSVLALVEKAIESCQSEREREGRHLKDLCIGFMVDFRQIHSEICLERDGYSSEIRERFRLKFDKIFQDKSLGVNEERYLQEVALLVEKSDIEEELNRFLEHVSNVEKLITSGGSDGKKLDFYAQELLREVNTIGSKSQYANITGKVVALKSKIEQFREQVQNIE